MFGTLPGTDSFSTGYRGKYFDELFPILRPDHTSLGVNVTGLVHTGGRFLLAAKTSMTLGIVVDDTIHFQCKYLRARREKNLSSADATRYTTTRSVPP